MFFEKNLFSNASRNNSKRVWMRELGKNSLFFSCPQEESLRFSLFENKFRGKCSLQKSLRSRSASSCNLPSLARQKIQADFWILLNERLQDLNKFLKRMNTFFFAKINLLPTIVVTLFKPVTTPLPSCAFKSYTFTLTIFKESSLSAIVSGRSKKLKNINTKKMSFSLSIEKKKLHDRMNKLNRWEDWVKFFTTSNPSLVEQMCGSLHYCLEEFLTKQAFFSVKFGETNRKPSKGHRCHPLVMFAKAHN